MTKLLQFLLCLLLLFVSSNVFSRTKILYEKETSYTYLKVYQRNNIRSLRFLVANRRIEESVIDIKNPYNIQRMYIKLSFAFLLFNKEPSDILILGLGGGTVPTNLAHYFPNCNIDVVEIDDEVVKVARKYFLYKDIEKPRLNTYVTDARVFVKRAKKKYDVVFMNAFRGSYTPFHLKTIEFYKEIIKVLKPNGILQVNFWNRKKYYSSDRKTFDNAFKHSYVFRYYGNSIIVGSLSNKKMPVNELMNRAILAQRKNKFEFNFVSVVEKYKIFESYNKLADVFTDDFAPINLLE